MATVEHSRATLDDLMRNEGKAELIGGRTVALMPAGRRPSRIAARIYRSLDDFAETLGLEKPTPITWVSRFTSSRRAANHSRRMPPTLPAHSSMTP